MGLLPIVQNRGLGAEGGRSRCIFGLHGRRHSTSDGLDDPEQHECMCVLPPVAQFRDVAGWCCSANRNAPSETLQSGNVMKIIRARLAGEFF